MTMQKYTFAFQMLREYRRPWASRNGAVQMRFLTATRKMSAEKFYKIFGWFGEEYF